MNTTTTLKFMNVVLPSEEIWKDLEKQISCSLSLNEEAEKRLITRLKNDSKKDKETIDKLMTEVKNLDDSVTSKVNEISQMQKENNVTALKIELCKQEISENIAKTIKDEDIYKASIEVTRLELNKQKLKNSIVEYRRTLLKILKLHKINLGCRIVNDGTRFTYYFDENPSKWIILQTKDRHEWDFVDASVGQEEKMELKSILLNTSNPLAVLVKARNML